MSKTCSSVSSGIIALKAIKKLAEKAKNNVGDQPPTLDFDEILDILKEFPVKDWCEADAAASLEQFMKYLDDHNKIAGTVETPQLISSLTRLGNTGFQNENETYSLESLKRSLSDENDSAFDSLSGTKEYEATNEQEVIEWSNTFFKHAIYLQSKVMRDFTSNRIIIPALIGEGNKLPSSENYEAMEGVNRNIKDAKTKLLISIVKEMGDEFTLEEKNKIYNLTHPDIHIAQDSYNYMQVNEKSVLEKVYKFVFNGDIAITPNLIERASMHYKKLDNESKKVIDLYLNYVQYVSFDFLIALKGDDIITIGGTPFYDSKSIKYDYHRDEKKTAKIWNAVEVSDHAETQAAAVKLILDNTPIYSYIKRTIIEDVYMTSYMASEAWEAARDYYVSTDPEGVFKAFNKALKSDSVSPENKDIIYTLQTLFFDPNISTSLKAKSSLVNGDLLNVLINNFRTQVEMKFSEVQERGKGNFSLISLNNQLGGNALFELSATLSSNYERMLNNNYSELPLYQRDDLDALPDIQLVNLISSFLGMGNSLSLKNTGTGKSQADCLIDSHDHNSLVDLCVKAQNLYGLILDSKTTARYKTEPVSITNNKFTVKINNTTKYYLSIADDLINAKKKSEGYTKKVTIRNSHNTTNASVSKANLISRLKDQFNRIRRHTNAIDNNFKLFEKNPLISNEDAFQGIVFRGDIVTSGNDPVLNAKASVAESTIYNIVHFYAEQLAKNESPYFDFTNFSDKTLNGAIRINRKFFVKPDKVDGTKAILDHKQKVFVEMQKDYLNKSAERILGTYQAILDHMSLLGLINKTVLTRSDNYATDLINLNETLDSIFGKNQKFEVKGKKLNNSELLNYISAKEGINIINYIDYNDNNIRIKDTLIKEIIIFNDDVKVNAFLDAQFKDFAHGLVLNNVNLAVSKESVDLIDNACKALFGEDNKLSFPRGNNPSGKIPIEFKQAYFYDWLLASNATMNATAGHCINQKAGGLVTTSSKEDLIEFAKPGKTVDFDKFLQSHLKNLSNLWQAQTKRNVIFTASMLNYNINNERGLKGGAQVAFVNDLETKLKPIGVGAQKVTDWDGASIGFMHHMIRLYRSLGGHFSSDGGIDQKSFINFLDPLTGSSTLIKHALFAMTPGVVKASLGNDMSIIKLYENIYRKHSLKGINILEGDSQLTESLAKPKNLYYYSDLNNNSIKEGAIVKIDSITKVNDPSEPNTYIIIEKHLAKGTQEYRKVVIENMWDLMKALYAFNTLIPSNNKTNYSSFDYNDSDTKYFKPSFGAFEYLVDVEDANTDTGLYKHYAFLDKNKLATEILTESITTKLNHTPNHEAIMKEGYNKFITTINGGSKVILKEVLQKIVEDGSTLTNDASIKYFAEQTLNIGDDLIERAYQPLKGVMTDMVTTYGGAKVGQTNMNSLQTLLGVEQDPENQIEGYNTLYHKLINYENGGVQVDTVHDFNHAELSMPKQMLAALNFGMLEGERAQELNQIFSSLILENIQEDLNLSNYLNGSIDIANRILSNIVKDTSIISMVEEMLKDKDLHPYRIQQLTSYLNHTRYGDDIMKLVSNLEVKETIQLMLDEGITSFNTERFKNTLIEVITKHRKNEHIADNIAKKFTELLSSKVDLDNASMAAALIEAFKDNIPIDHSTILKEAVSALASSFSNKAARLKFDGLLAVIQPASKMIQVVEMEGDASGVTIYSRVGNKIKERKLYKGETATLIGEQVEIQAIYSGVNPQDLYAHKRELKGPELIGTLIETDENGVETESKFIGSVLDVDYDEKGEIVGVNSQFSTSLAIDGLEELVKSIGNGKYDLPKNADTRGLLNYWAAELGLKEVKTPATLKALINTIQVKELDLKINPGQNIEEAIKNDSTIIVKTQRAIGSRAKKSIEEDIVTAMETGKPAVSAFINPDFWANKTIKDLTVTPGEIVAPMLFAEQFMLEEGDDFNNISEEFFLNKLIAKRTIKYVEKPPFKILTSNSSENVAIYTNKKDFDEEVKNLKPINSTETHLLDSMGKNFLEFTHGMHNKVYRRSDNSLVILVDKAQFKDNPALLHESLANVKGTFNKAFKAGFRLNKYISEDKLRDSLKFEAQKMWEAFKLFNEVTGARIPGQHYQSFQYLKVIGWINDKQSAVWVPRATTLFSGSDFDVDKLNIIYRSINRAGQLEVWNPLMSTLRGFQEQSYTMPTPEKLSRGTFNSRYVNSDFKVGNEMIQAQDNAAITANYIMESLKHITEIEDENDLKNYLLALAETKGQQLFELLNEAYEFILETNINRGASKQAIELLKNSFADLYKLLNSGEKIGLLVKNPLAVDPRDPVKEFFNPEVRAEGIKKLNALGYKNHNRRPDGRVIGCQSGWKLRFNLKNKYYDPKDPESTPYFRDTVLNNPEQLDYYNKTAGVIIGTLIEYFKEPNETTRLIRKGDSEYAGHVIIDDIDGKSREPFKHLGGGHIGEADFTIYIGSKDDAMKFIDDMKAIEGLEDLLVLGEPSTDISFGGVFAGRFEGKDIGFSGYYGPGDLEVAVPNLPDSFFIDDNIEIFKEKDVWGNPVYMYEDHNLGDINKLSYFSRPDLRGGNAYYKEYRNKIAAMLYGEYAYGSDDYKGLGGKKSKKAKSYKTQISTTSYKKGDPQRNPDINYIFTENAEAYIYINNIGNKESYNFPFKGDPTVNVKSDNNNQAGIRTNSKGEPTLNAFGVIVKKYQQNEKGEFIDQEGCFKDTPEDFEMFKSLNTHMFERLEKSSKNLVILPRTMALGKAALPYDFAKWLKTELKNRFNIKSALVKNNNTKYEGYGLALSSNTKETKIDHQIATPAFKGKMTYEYGNEKLDSVKSNSTIEAIINGERTSTTRYSGDENISYWKKIKVGDIIEFTDGKGMAVHVRVTKALTRLNPNTDPQAWCNKEGWSLDYFEKSVKPRIDDAYQIEYEFVASYIGELNNNGHLVHDTAVLDKLSVTAANEERKLPTHTIISGAQDGIDQLGLTIGKELGLTTGGTAPKGFKIAGGAKSYSPEELAGFGVKPIDPEVENAYWNARPDKRRNAYVARTEQNVINSDGTIYFSTPKDSAGLNATRNAANDHGKPFLANPKTSEEIVDFLINHNIKILNIAGNRGSAVSEEMEQEVTTLLKQALSITTSKKKQQYEKVRYARFDNNGYEVSSKGDNRFSALVAKFAKGTIIDGHDVGGRTIESVYQNGIKQNDWNTDSNKKTKKPGKSSKLYNSSISDQNELENFSYEVGYLPLWEEWADQNPELIEDLRQKSKGKVLTDEFASTEVSQARALADILNKLNSSEAEDNYFPEVDEDEDDDDETDTIEKDETLMVSEQYNALVDFLYIINRAIPSISGYKNAIINQKDKITRSPRTFVAASSPMSMDDLKNVAKGDIESTKFAYKQVTPYNPNAPVIQHVNNMVGKDSVGVVAVALKAYSGVTIAYKAMLDNIRSNDYSLDDAETLTQVINSGFKFNGNTYNIAADTDLTKYLREDLITVEFLNSMPANLKILLTNIYDDNNKVGAFRALSDDNKVKVLRDILIRDKYRGDSAEFKSELLSAATDNAKELLISKLGVNDNTIKIYATAMALAIPPADIHAIMTGPTIKALMALTTSNVFNKKVETKTLESLIRAIIKLETGKKSEGSIKWFNETYEPYNLKYSEGSFELSIYKTDNTGKPKLEKVTLNLKDIKNVSQLFKASDEFSMLGNLFGVNQGIKSTLTELNMYKDKLEKYMSSYYRSFSFDEFIRAINSCIMQRKDPMEDPYIAKIIKIMNTKKVAFNVPAIIAYNPTFAAQMMTVVATTSLLEKNTLRYSLIKNLVKTLEDSGAKYYKTPVNRKTGDALNRYSNDLMANLFLSTSKDICTINGDNNVLDLSIPGSRQRFINYMNEKVIPELKNNYPDNTFLEKLIVDTIKDPVTKAELKIAKMTVSTSGKVSTADAASILGTLIYGIKSLQNESFNGVSVIKLLELYNFIVYKDDDTGKAWGKYIMMASDNLKDTLSSKYVRFLQNAKKFHITSNMAGINIYNQSKLMAHIPLLDILKYSGIVKIENIIVRQDSNDDLNEDEDFLDSLEEFDEISAEDLEISEDYEELVDEDEDDYRNSYDNDEEGSKSNIITKYKIVNKLQSNGVGLSSFLEIYKENLSKKSDMIKKIKTDQATANKNGKNYIGDLKPSKNSYTETHQYRIGNSLSNPTGISVSKEFVYQSDREVTSRAETVRATTLLADKLQVLNPGIDLKLIMRGPENSYIQKNSIYINLDLADTNTVVHEFGHALITLLKYDEPEIYQRLMNEADNLPGAEGIRNSYSKEKLYINNEDKIKEEIVVNALTSMANSGIDSNLLNTKKTLEDLSKALEFFTETISNAADIDLKLNTPLNLLLHHMLESIHRKSLVDITRSRDASKELNAIDKILTELEIKCSN